MMRRRESACEQTVRPRARSNRHIYLIRRRPQHRASLCPNLRIASHNLTSVPWLYVSSCRRAGMVRDRERERERESERGAGD
eukprot:3935372-Pyramimonas_sp.AAC.1